MGVSVAMNMDYIPALSTQRITESLSADPLNGKVIWWRGYLAGLDEWKEGWGHMFALLHSVSMSPSIESFQFDFDIDCYSADVEIPAAVSAEIASQPVTFDGDQEADDSCWISRSNSIAGVAKEYLDHGHIRKLLLTRIHSLKVAFKSQIPAWIVDWWSGYLHALHEGKILTSKDVGCFGELLPASALPET